MDFFRPFLFPVTICLFLAGFWIAARAKQLDAEERRVYRQPVWVDAEPVASGEQSHSYTN